MADWTAPFHRPHMPTWEFNRRRDEYVKKHGYTITIPGPEDIFHFGTERPMTVEEQGRWKAKDYNWFNKDRYEEIKYMKKRRKDKYLAMLGSPSPHILNSRTAIITAIDDAQDALSTLGAIGTLVYAAATAGVKKMIQGPLGWTLAAGDALNYVNKKLIPEARMMENKRTSEAATGKGMKSSKARIKREVNWLKKAGWRGKVTEGLQVTDNVYGEGISLGAVMNLPIDAASGIVRGAGGQEVHIKLPDIDVGHWGRVARRLVRNWLSFEGIPSEYRKEEHHSPIVVTTHQEGISSFLTDEEQNKMRVGLFLAQQTIHMTADKIGPPGISLPFSDMEIKAPTPTNLLTLEVIRELDDDPGEGNAWPATGEQWSNVRDLMEESSKHITANANGWAKRGNHSVAAWAVGQQSTNSALYALENIAGKGTVQIENTPSFAAINSLQALNFCVDQELTNGQERIFAEYMSQCDDTDYTPSAKEVVTFAQRHCGFNFVQMIR